MKQSVDRILTTHTGSLPRPPDMLGLLVEEQQARLVRPTGRSYRPGFVGARRRSGCG